MGNIIAQRGSAYCKKELLPQKHPVNIKDSNKKQLELKHHCAMFYRTAAKCGYWNTLKNATSEV